MTYYYEKDGFKKYTYKGNLDKNPNQNDLQYYYRKEITHSSVEGENDIEKDVTFINNKWNDRKMPQDLYLSSVNNDMMDIYLGRHEGVVFGIMISSEFGNLDTQVYQARLIETDNMDYKNQRGGYCLCPDGNKYVTGATGNDTDGYKLSCQYEPISHLSRVYMNLNLSW